MLQTTKWTLKNCYANKFSKNHILQGLSASIFFKFVHPSMQRK